MSQQRDPVPAVRKPSPRCCRGQHSWETHPAAHLCKNTGNFKARSLRGAGTAQPASPGSVTALARGKRRLSNKPSPPAMGKKAKNKTQEHYSFWLSKPCVNFQRIYGILKFSPSAEHFSKTKHLHPLQAGRAGPRQ